MSQDEDFNQLSYRSHEKQYCNLTCDDKHKKNANTIFEIGTIDTWRHLRMYKPLDSLLTAYPNAKWLTVGDGRYGTDAHYIQEKGLKVLATDISDILLKEGQKIGFIDDYKKENAESLSFANEQFDFVLCKESYHHFPRPMIALYEMLRVAKKGVVLIEPYDRYTAPNFLEVLFTKCFDLVKIILHKNNIRHDFEVSGNYVYGISKREIEKVALGMNYKVVAFNGVSDYYVKGVENEKTSRTNKLFIKVKTVLFFKNLLVNLKLKQHSLLIAVIYKKDPPLTVKETLSKDGYEVITLPENPYL